MANNGIPYMDWLFSNLAETFKLFKQRLELYFVVNKIKSEQQVKYILLRVGNKGLKKQQHMVINGGRKTYSWNYF